VIVYRITALLTAVLFYGCGFGDGPFSTLQSPVVGGTPADDDPGTVLVVIPGGRGCTGTVISERVVLTAKHCTSGTTADQWRVLVGPAPLQVATRDAEYLVAEIRETPGDGTGVGEDLAAMLLDEDFEFDFYRWAFEGHSSVEVGAPVRHVGFGNTIAGDSGSAGSRNTRSGNLTAVFSGSLNAEVGACPGDSGGPLFNADDVLLGVAHDILTSDCSGDARFTRLEPWADFVNNALTATGGCVPTAWDDPCNDGVDNDCNGTVDDGCNPQDAGTDAGGGDAPQDGTAQDADAGGGGDDAGTGGDDAGRDSGSGTDTGDYTGDYTGSVKGGCSTSGGNPGLVLLVLVILYRGRRSTSKKHRSRRTA
jgi:V8-like Glu-specific endopeptidase